MALIELDGCAHQAPGMVRRREADLRSDGLGQVLRQAAWSSSPESST